jgi:hypothetical protein
MGVILAEGMAARNGGRARDAARSSEGTQIGEPTPTAAPFPTDDGFDFPPRYWRARRLAMRVYVGESMVDQAPLTEDDALIISEHFAAKDLQRAIRYPESQLLRSCVRDWFVARAAILRAAP